jgi:LDH2 family malate/lactate/ureidoglycolate dehydrogenase
VEGRGNPGILITQIALTEALTLARKNGIGIVGTRGTFSSSGCLSYYLEKIAKNDFIAIIMAESPEGVAPDGSIQPLFGTNPISFGIPAIPAPLIFDMATSAISYGAILKAKTLGQTLPENVAIDVNGNITTDPEEALKGAILPFDNSYKGAGLAMIVEILAGILPGATFAIHNKEAGWGNLFIVLTPNLLSDTKEFKEKVQVLRETIRNSRTKKGTKVRISGEKTIETRDLNLRKGWVEVDERLITLIKTL